MDKMALKDELDRRGRGAQAALAAYLGVSASVMNKMINTPRPLRADEADRIRAFFAKEPAATGRSPEQSNLFDRGSLHRVPAQAAMDPSIKVFASAQGGDEGALVISNDPVAYIKRPPLLEGVPEGYAVYISGDSMSPAYEAGDLALVNPSLPPMPKNYCIFQGARGDGSQLALIKRLVKEAAGAWSVKQYEPAKTFMLSKSQWSRAHVIVGKYERV